MQIDSYVPKTRSDLGIPLEKHPINYDEYFGDTPIYTMFLLVRQQLLAFPSYLLFNVSGQKSYPKWTNHFDRMCFSRGYIRIFSNIRAANSVIFNKAQRNSVILSNVGIFIMAWIVTYAISVFGTAQIVKYYGIPWFMVTHWVCPSRH